MSCSASTPRGVKRLDRQESRLAHQPPSHSTAPTEQASRETRLVSAVPPAQSPRVAARSRSQEAPRLHGSIHGLGAGDATSPGRTWVGEDWGKVDAIGRELGHHWPYNPPGAWVSSWWKGSNDTLKCMDSARSNVPPMRFQGILFGRGTFPPTQALGWGMVEVLRLGDLEMSSGDGDHSEGHSVMYSVTPAAPGIVSIGRVGTPHEFITNKELCRDSDLCALVTLRMLSQPPISVPVTARIPRRKEGAGSGKPVDFPVRCLGAPGQPMETCSVPPTAKTRSPTCPLLHARMASAPG